MTTCQEAAAGGITGLMPVRVLNHALKHAIRASEQETRAWPAARGYGDDLYEYANDLYCRNRLHEAWLLLDEHVVQLWIPQIKALDARIQGRDHRRRPSTQHSNPVGSNRIQP
ncbi:hypothetical protein ACWDX6_21305 [Streptomyces sp. NPDC003027]